jgi:hypothetical protein
MIKAIAFEHVIVEGSRSTSRSSCLRASAKGTVKDRILVSVTSAGALDISGPPAGGEILVGHTDASLTS